MSEEFHHEDNANPNQQPDESSELSPAPKVKIHVSEARETSHHRSTSRGASRRSLTAVAPVSETEPQDEFTEDPAFSAMHRASVVVAARYRSALRSSSLHRETAVNDPTVHSKKALSEGEVLVMEKMMEGDRRQREVLRRAEIINEQAVAVLEAQELEKEQRNMEKLRRVAAERDQKRQERARSLQARQAENAKRRKEIEAQRQAKIAENIRRVNTVRYDPFSYIAMRQRYSSPPRNADDQKSPRGSSARRKKNKESGEEGGESRNRSRSTTVRSGWK